MVSRDDEKSRLRDLLLDGAASPLLTPVDAAYFGQLRVRASGNKAESFDGPSPSIACDEDTPLTSWRIVAPCPDRVKDG